MLYWWYSNRIYFRRLVGRLNQIYKETTFFLLFFVFSANYVVCFDVCVCVCVFVCLFVYLFIFFFGGVGAVFGSLKKQNAIDFFQQHFRLTPTSTRKDNYDWCANIWFIALVIVFFFLVKSLLMSLLINEHRHEKTCLRGFRPGTTQTGLLIYRD